MFYTILGETILTFWIYVAIVWLWIGVAGGLLVLTGLGS